MRQLKLNPTRQALLEKRAHAMRHAPSPPEEILWRHLSGRKLGVAFRRQVPLAGRYIADFLAPTVRLVVEVDGAFHSRQPAADARRDRVLQRLGYRVLRLPASLVIHEPLIALARIRHALNRC